jgi:hypothetical protein
VDVTHKNWYYLNIWVMRYGTSDLILSQRWRRSKMLENSVPLFKKCNFRVRQNCESKR